MRSTLSIYGIAILVGLITGIVGSYFQLAVSCIVHLVEHLMRTTSAKGWEIALFSTVFSTILVGISWLMVVKIAPEGAGSGVQEIEGVLLHERPIFWRRLLPVKFIGGMLSISAHMAVGREGPTIQMGGNLGAMLAEWCRQPIERRDALIAAGAAAGLATAFNAPLAGLLFVLEEMQGKFKFSLTHFTAVTICCTVATIALHYIVGSKTSIVMNIFPLPDENALWTFFIFGIGMGFVGLLFNKALMGTLRITDRFSHRAMMAFILCAGAVVGFLAYWSPYMVGGGYEIISYTLQDMPTITALLALSVVRFCTTILCYNTGVPGGIFAPLLALGTLLGLAAFSMFKVCHFPLIMHPGVFAVAGMGALFSASVRAPVTGIVLVVELTQNYSLILPLMISCLAATTVVQLANNLPIYTQLLDRTMRKNKSTDPRKETPAGTLS